MSSRESVGSGFSRDTRCPYCNGRGRFLFGYSSKSYGRCSECDLIYRLGTYSYQNVLKTYERGYFDAYSVDQRGGNRQGIYRHILDLLKKSMPPGKILDVGAGCGDFLALAKVDGWEIYGIDPSSESMAAAKDRYGIEIFHGTLKDLPKKPKFDAVTFINVLDHSAEPWTEVETAMDLLVPGGILYLRLPNGLLHATLLRTAQAFNVAHSMYRFLVFHQFSMTPRHIESLLRTKGFDRIRTACAPPSIGDPHHLFQKRLTAAVVKYAAYLTGRCIEKASFNRFFLCPSIEVTALKPA